MDILTGLTIVNNGWNIIKSFFPKQNKSQILDPFSTIIRLGLIGYKPNGTKIGISDNRLIIHDKGPLQGTYRTINGDQKEDVLNLSIHIENACRIYLDKRNDKFIFFFNKAKDGLIKLKHTYSDYPVISRNLNDNINIIDKYITRIETSDETYEDGFLVDNSTILNELHIRKTIYETLKNLGLLPKLTSFII